VNSCELLLDRTFLQGSLLVTIETDVLIDLTALWKVANLLATTVMIINKLLGNKHNKELNETPAKKQQKNFVFYES
jgi:hypothetical protein